MITAGQLVDTIIGRRKRQTDPIGAYWFVVSTDRESFLADVVHAAGSLPLLPFVVRDRLFQNPNAFMMDIIEVLNSHRDAVLRRLQESTSVSDYWTILLLAKAPLDIANSASPATIPDWFPKLGGQTLYIRLEDLSARIDSALNTADLQLEQICRAIHELDRLLIRRWSDVHAADHRLSNSLWDLLRRNGDAKCHEFLAAARDFVASIKNPEGYRPSIRDGVSLASRLWGAYQTTSPDGLGRLTKAMAAALQLDPRRDQFHECFASVLSRPTQPDTGDQRLARSIVASIACGLQLATATAHAGEYCSYPVTLMTAVATDLLDALGAAQAELLRLDPPTRKDSRVSHVPERPP